MKNLIVAIVVLVSSMVIASPSDTLIEALITVESNGNSSAIGDNGKAVGCLQIWKNTVDDVNRIYKTSYSYEDRKSKSKSIEICKKYISHYATKKRLGRIPTDEDYARIWNGGPNGYKKPATVKYWNKVSRYM